MFSAKFQPIIFAFFMAFLMSCIMSFVITLFNIGWVDNVISLWLQAWSFAFVVAFPTVFFVAPVVRRLTAMMIRMN